MLKRLLALLETGGTWRISELATELGTTPDLVNAMLSHLHHSGKIDLPPQPCSHGCAGCSLPEACKVQPANETFVYVSRACERPELKSTL